MSRVEKMMNGVEDHDEDLDGDDQDVMESELMEEGAL
jgi:hypothetical protein